MMSDTESSSTTTTIPRRLFLITHPRSASHLLIRILSLNSQPNFSTRQHGGYFFFPAFLVIADKLKLYAKPLSDWTPTERQTVQETYQACADDLQDAATKADAEGKVLFVKDHASFMVEPVALSRLASADDAAIANEGAWTVRVADDGHQSSLLHSPLNVTVLPDAFLHGWHPTFLIRHPALAFPSYRRATGAPSAKLASQMTLKWTRALYEWWDAQFRQVKHCEDRNDDADASEGEGEAPAAENVGRSHHWPIVLDADDVMLEPAVLTRWCGIAGLDASKLAYSWTPLSPEQVSSMSPVAQMMTISLSGSAGVLVGKTAKGIERGGRSSEVEGRIWGGRGLGAGSNGQGGDGRLRVVKGEEVTSIVR